MTNYKPYIELLDPQYCQCTACGTKSILRAIERKEQCKYVVRYCRDCEAQTPHVTRWGQPT